MVEVQLDRTLVHVELRGDLLVSESSGHDADDLDLARRQQASDLPGPGLPSKEPVERQPDRPHLQPIAPRASPAELVRLAAEREKALAALVESEPGAVLRLALPRDVRASLPPSVRAQVEEEVEMEGVVEVLHEDRASGSRYLYFLEAAGERYSLHFAREAPALVTGTRVRVKGVRIGHALAL